MKILAFFISSLLLMPPLSVSAAEESPQDVFSRIYRQGEWGRNSSGEGISGAGSIYENAKPYVDLLQAFLIEHDIKSVVDVGCGDWELSRHIQWGSIQYYGYDVVERVVAKNQTNYGSSKIHFICADGINENLPPADLLVCKDVLQHLPNRSVHTLISKLNRFKYCLITNDISAPSAQKLKVNIDIPLGSWRLIDLTEPPFSIKAKTILTYASPGTVKRVVLIGPEN